jgi:hypothetical protein
MKWFDRIERKYSKYAIKNLMYYIIALYILGFVIDLFAPELYVNYLQLDAQKILQGQLWRIVTFIIQPPNTSIIFAVFVLYFYYMIGTVLESIWGAFRFNVYFITGVLLQVIACIAIYLIFGVNFSMSTYYINLALFMAFAIEQPNMQIMLFFVLPIKIKWLAWLDAAIFAITIIGGYLVYYMPVMVILRLARSGIALSPEIATTALISMLHFIAFAILYKKGPARTETQRNFKKAYKTAQKAEKKRKESFNERFYNANSERTNWQQANQPYQMGRGTKHRCAVCGRTELDGDDLIFRYCSKCEGNLEYCQDHLYTHIHVLSKNTKNDNVVNINK